jgi:AcrR family transcriptional regulator
LAKRRTRNASLERRLGLLWGTAERAGRGPKPGLTLDGIIQGAVAVADAEGLRALTMRRVARKLGVTTMALYRYVPAKEALIDAMVQAALGAPPPVDAGDWRASLERWARADRVVFDRHPWLLDLATCAPVGPNWLAWLEAGLRSLSSTGLSPAEMIAVMGVVDGHVRNIAQLARGPVDDLRGSRSEEEWQASFFRVLDNLRGDPRYPTLSHIVASGALNEQADEFEFGLQRVLDGIGAFIEERAADRIPAARVAGELE